MSTIAPTELDGGKLATLLAGHRDKEIRVPSDFTARTLEKPLLIIHCLYGLLDNTFAVRRTLI